MQSLVKCLDHRDMTDTASSLMSGLLGTLYLFRNCLYRSRMSIGTHTCPKSLDYNE